MLGRAHALSGVTGWLSLCAGAAALGHTAQPSTVVVGAAVAAGAALGPDIDHPGSTVSRSLGPWTKAASWAFGFVADAVQDATCSCCKDDDRSAHRGLSHTALGALAGGMLTASVCRFGGPAVSVLAGWAGGNGWLDAGQVAAIRVHAAEVVPFLVVFAFAGLAVLGLLPGRRRARKLAVVVGVAAAASAAGMGLGGGSWWWLGVPVAVGNLLHIAGDWLTRSGVPVLWPLKIRDCRWYPLGAPWRFRAGAWQEKYVVTVLLAAGAVGAGWVLVR